MENKMNAQNNKISTTINVGLIVIGDELLSGRTRESNSHFLAKTLINSGFNLNQIIIIEDQESAIQEALHFFSNSNDVIITSGGLGPTLDDKTKLSLAHFYNQKIIENKDIVKLVKCNYARFQREWNPSLNHYHYFPEKFFGINNPKGFAPGLGFKPQMPTTKRTQLILCAPGVPREFEAMVTDEFLPLMRNHFPHSHHPKYEVVIRTKGIPEEKIFNELCPQLWSTLSHFGKVSSLPGNSGIDIVITIQSKTSDFKNNDSQTFTSTENTLFELVKSTPLHSYVWQYGRLSLAQLVLDRARALKKTFGFAESCTGGLLSSKITDLSGSSLSFMGGVISYDNSIKESLLFVSHELIQKWGAVSAEVAEAMALGAQKKLQTDLSIALTGIAGPTGGSVEKPIGTLFIGYSFKNTQTNTLQSGTKKFHFSGDRLRLKERFTEEALYTLLELLNS